MEIGFSAVDIGVRLGGQLLYRINEDSFDYVPNEGVGLEEITGSKGRTSILIGTLQLEVAIETKIALYAWGYVPRVSWLRTKLHEPRAAKSGLRVMPSSELQPGISTRLATVGEWRTEYDSESGWVVLASVPDPTAGESIEFAENTVATLSNGQLVAVWLRPKLVE